MGNRGGGLLLVNITRNYINVINAIRNIKTNGCFILGTKSRATDTWSGNKVFIILNRNEKRHSVIEGKLLWPLCI